MAFVKPDPDQNDWSYDKYELFEYRNTYFPEPVSSSSEVSIYIVN